MEFYERNELPSMRNKQGALKSPPYCPEGKRRKTKCPGTADIIPLEYVPSECRSEERGASACGDRELERKIGKQLRLSNKMVEEVNQARLEGQEVFKHSFGSRGNTIEVFLTVDCEQPSPPLSLPKGTIEDAERLGETFEEIDIGPKGFYVALDKNFKQIFVVFRSGLKLVYGGETGQYISDAICWNIEEYAEIVPPTLAKDSRHKGSEDWLRSNPHLCWPPWARAGVYYWGIWMEQGHNDKGSVLSRDINAPCGRAKPVQSRLFKSLGALTRAQ